MDEELEKLYADLAPRVVGYFRSHGAPDPEDLAGDVFVRVVRARRRLPGSEPARRRWVFSIAHNLLVDHYRRTGRRPEVLTATPAERPAEDPGPIDPQLIAALSNLTADQREVVVLRFVGDLSVGAVARLLGKRPGAVKMLQSRALESLQKILDPTVTESGSSASTRV